MQRSFKGIVEEYFVAAAEGMNLKDVAGVLCEAVKI